DGRKGGASDHAPWPNRMTNSDRWSSPRFFARWRSGCVSRVPPRGSAGSPGPPSEVRLQDQLDFDCARIGHFSFPETESKRRRRARRCTYWEKFPRVALQSRWPAAAEPKPNREAVNAWREWQSGWSDP